MISNMDLEKDSKTFWSSVNKLLGNDTEAMRYHTCMSRMELTIYQQSKRSGLLEAVAKSIHYHR